MVGVDDDALIEEWLYGPPDQEAHEETTGEVYFRMEEEDRLRWIPGYRELVLEYIRSAEAWHAQWTPGEDYPPEPERRRQLRTRLDRLRELRPRGPVEVNAYDE